MNKFEIEHDGHTFYGDVSLCSGPSYGLQVKVSLKDGAANAVSEFVRDGKLVDPFLYAVQAPMLALGWILGQPDAHQYFLDMAVKHEKVMAELTAELEVENKKEAKRSAAYDAKMKVKGYTHKVNAWVHPNTGDDYRVEAFYQGKPTEADIARLLRRSVVKTDCSITVL